MPKSDIRVVVGIDFGTTYSGFALASVANPDTVETNESWPGIRGQLKTNTALAYDEALNVVKWGNPALSEKPSKKKLASSEKKLHKPVELFKLHFSNIKNSEKPPLLPGLDYQSAVADYLREMGKLIRQTLETRWPGIDFFKHVRLVVTVPAEYNEYAKGAMRTCMFKSGLLKTLNSDRLEFTTEPEAAAIYCMRVLKEFSLKPNDSFMIVDCGGGTTDLTIRRLLAGGRLEETTENSGEFCGSTFIDREFLKYLARKLGMGAIAKLKEDHYSQLQYLLQEFCSCVKLRFDGDRETFQAHDLDLEDACPIIKKYVVGEAVKTMEDAEWLIELDFDTVKEFFDKVVVKILRLIRDQLMKTEKPCSALFLVGGFGQSPYLLKRVREEFNSMVPFIAVPIEPIASTVRGAVYYGLDMDIVRTRVLKRTYGIDISRDWKEDDPIQRRVSGNVIDVFQPLAFRGSKVDVDQKFTCTLYPSYPEQRIISFPIYTTDRDSAKYCDEDGMKQIGKLTAELPDVYLGKNRPIEFSLTFGKIEIRATARNRTSGEVYETSFDLEYVD
ncbi:11585_t:CDS:10 [Ambispora gerdemannii]|uniref:11585_t:CDS:1 n=1 Tax=Ambispora gerdemannii TaxID=144530 RepID=A0A9N8W6X2_9GLOM|nr:11585_t:CDS:10 [Ambispora gerdemannii]